jgi:glucose-1-phosphate thymidylyltransferase
VDKATEKCYLLLNAMKCMVLAGGYGTRLYSQGVSQAKTLIEYKGEPLIDHLIRKIPRDIPVLVSTNLRFAPDLRRWQQETARDIDLCVEQTSNNEQKYGAVSSLDFWIESKGITEDLLVIAGDNYFEFDLARFIAAYNRKYTLVAVHDIGDTERARQFGVIRLEGDRIIELEEKPVNPGSSIVATGCYILPARVFPILRQYCSVRKRDNLGSFISHLITVDKVYSFIFAETWLDIGSQPV